MKVDRNNQINLFNRFLSLFALIIVAGSMQIIMGANQLELKNLRTEYKVNPIGIDVKQPRLSWEIVINKRNFFQHAYQIRAALSEEKLISNQDLIWNSGKVTSEQSNNLLYNGPALLSGQKIYWQVKIWGKDGEVSNWSNVVFWEMGLLKPSDWQAKWIEADLIEETGKLRPSPMLRKELEIKKEINSARLYITCHGLFELKINGEKQSDELFTPGWTSYNKRLQYLTYDVTNCLKNGSNAVALTLGDGWYRGFLGWERKRNFYGEKLALLLQINIEYKDGTKEILGTDSSWKSSYGPILMSNIYDGEIYDARLEKAGWDKPGFNDKDWNGTVEKDYSKEILVAPQGPPIRTTKTIKPVKKIIAANGDLIFDMGQNMVGWIRFKLNGNTGTKITLRHAEVLDKEGNFYTENLRDAEQKVEYTFKGSGEEIFEPHFTFQGFRYVQVKDYTGDISLENITGKVIHSDMNWTGNFECSDSLVNQLQKNIQWGLRGNFLDVPTDCPQRDERLGWTGDAQVFASTACFNVDAAAFYTKWMKDFIADQKKDGAIPWVIPDILSITDGSEKSGATGWADADIIVPWTVYQNYGDTRILETQYESMKEWINFMKSKSSDSFLFNKWTHFGDWLAFATTNSDYPGATTDKDLVATAYFYYSTSLMQKIAAILGKEQDAKEFDELRQNIRNGFQKEFLSSTGRLSSNTQTAYVLALAFDLIPDNMKENAAKRLVDDVNNFGHITTGFLGTPLICKVLTENGYPNLAYLLLFRKQYPSWLYAVSMGATTIWERWDGIKPDGTFQDKGMNSFNHYAYGAVGKWLYSSVAGIDCDPEGPGYKKIIINPYPIKKLNYAKAEYHSIYGKVSSHWQYKNDGLILSVVIPPNTTAKVFLPTDKKENILENGKPISTIKEISVSGVINNKTVLEIGSGEYNFEIKNVK